MLSRLTKVDLVQSCKERERAGSARGGGDGGAQVDRANLVADVEDDEDWDTDVCCRTGERRSGTAQVKLSSERSERRKLEGGREMNSTHR